VSSRITIDFTNHDPLSRWKRTLWALTSMAHCEDHRGEGSADTDSIPRRDRARASRLVDVVDGVDKKARLAASCCTRDKQHMHTYSQSQDRVRKVR